MLSKIQVLLDGSALAEDVGRQQEWDTIRT